MEILFIKYYLVIFKRLLKISNFFVWDSLSLVRRKTVYKISFSNVKRYLKYLIFWVGSVY